MSWRQRFERVFRYVAAAIGSAGMLGWLWAMGIWYQYLDHLPRSPNPMSGNIYSLNVHGTVVYQTLAQRLHRERWEFWSLAVAACGATLGAFLKWLAERRKGGG